MSISFTPTQLILVTACCTEAEFIRGAEYTSSEREVLWELYQTIPYQEFPSPNYFDDAGFPVGTKPAAEYQLEREAWRAYESERTARFDSDVIAVDRAFARFRKEFLFYTAGRCKLSVVREYHRYLIDTLAPFIV